MFLQRAQYWSLKLLSLYSITLAVFVFPHLIPGSPLTLYASWPITPQQQEQLTREYGFDRPLPSQYVIWLQRLLSGEWGTSRYYGRSVLPATGRATGLTLILLLWTILASCLWYALLRGLRRILPSSSSPSRPTWLFPVAAALPNFLIAIILRDVLIWQLGWISMANLPSFAPNYLLQPMYMLLPASVLALTLLLLWQACDNKTPAIPALSRQYRMRLHVAQFCVSFRPLLAGFLLEVLLIEFVFSLPGLGKFGIAALRRRDFPALQGFLLSTAGLYFVLQLVLDWGTHLPPRASALLAPAPHPRPRASSRRSVYGVIWCLSILFALATWAPQLVPHDPAEIHSNDQLLLPGYRYMLGTDFLGRDVLSRTVEGFRSAIPRAVFVTLCTGLVSLLVGSLGRLLPVRLRRIGSHGRELLFTMPPFLLAFMTFLVVEDHTWALEITLTIACLPLASHLLTERAPLLHRAANLTQLGSRVLILAVIFFFLNIASESLTPTWGVDIRRGMTYSHLNIWLLLTPILAVAWSRYSFYLLSYHLPTLTTSSSA